VRHECVLLSCNRPVRLTRQASLPVALSLGEFAQLSCLTGQRVVWRPISGPNSLLLSREDPPLLSPAGRANQANRLVRDWNSKCPSLERLKIPPDMELQPDARAAEANPVALEVDDGLTGALDEQDDEARRQYWHHTRPGGFLLAPLGSPYPEPDRSRKAAHASHQGPVSQPPSSGKHTTRASLKPNMRDTDRLQTRLPRSLR
jgi:hypothetical protein